MDCDVRGERAFIAVIEVVGVVGEADQGDIGTGQPVERVPVPTGGHQMVRPERPAFCDRQRAGNAGRTEHQDGAERPVGLRRTQRQPGRQSRVQSTGDLDRVGAHRQR